MRLIDAEQFIVEMENNIGNIYNPDIIKGMRFAVDFIKTLPTAYDVDKVVEQLEDLRKECESPLEEYCPNYFIDRAIEIVKVGGVNE